MDVFSQIFLIFRPSSLPYDISTTHIGFAFALFGQEIGGWTAVLSDGAYISYFLSLMLFISTIMKDVIITFDELNENIEKVGVKLKIIRKYFDDILKTHEIAIKYNK